MGMLAKLLLNLLQPSVVVIPVLMALSVQKACMHLPAAKPSPGSLSNLAKPCAQPSLS